MPVQRFATAGASNGHAAVTSGNTHSLDDGHGHSEADLAEFEPDSSNEGT